MIMITLTSSAQAHIQKMIEKTQACGFRLSIKKTGCSGYTYLPQVIEAIHPHDEVVNIDGLKIYLDTAWLDLLQDVQIDYQEEDKNGLKQKRLIFKNTKEAGRCGCGESFHVNEEKNASI
jgi:iron-sulfur cluster assembly protein